MNKVIRFLCGAAGFALIVSTGMAQTSVVWKAHESAMAAKDKQAGQSFDPQFAPSDPAWISYETESEDNRMLFVANDKSGKKFEVSTSKKKTEDENFLGSGAAAMRAGFNGDLAWAPVRIDGEQWFAFVGSGTRSNLDVYLGKLSDPPVVYRVTTDSSIDENPRWSPDGTQLLFTSTRSGLVDLYISGSRAEKMLAELAGLARRLPDDAEVQAWNREYRRQYGSDAD